MSQVTVGRWGRRLVIRLPDEIARVAGINEGDRVEIDAPHAIAQRLVEVDFIERIGTLHLRKRRSREGFQDVRLRGMRNIHDVSLRRNADDRRQQMQELEP